MYDSFWFVAARDVAVVAVGICFSILLRLHLHSSQLHIQISYSCLEACIATGRAQFSFEVSCWVKRFKKTPPKSNWQLKGGLISQKRKFCELLAISHHRRDLFIIQCTDKPYLDLVYPVGPRRKTTENLSVGYRYLFFWCSSSTASAARLHLHCGFRAILAHSRPQIQ